MTSAVPEWSRGTAEREAKGLFGNQALHRAAAAMAGCHPRALDYIRQAPVIVLSANAGMTGRRAASSARSFAGPPMAMLSQQGAKLRDVMSFYGCGVHLRRLFPSVLHPVRWGVIYHLGRLPPSTLSQIMPAVRGQQDVWLRALVRWSEHCERRCGSPWFQFEWAAVALREIRRGEEDTVTNVADMLIEAARPERRGNAIFEPRWTLSQAMAATERWHRVLGRGRAEEKTAKALGVGFSDPVDYAPFPNEATKAGELDFVPLRSCEDLWVEGVAMRHCVSTYSASVIQGACRIYSIQRGGRRVATVELARPTGADEREVGLHRIVQIKGPCNTKPSKIVVQAAEEFLTRTKDRIRDAGRLRAAFPGITGSFSEEASPAPLASTGRG